MQYRSLLLRSTVECAISYACSHFLVMPFPTGCHAFHSAEDLLLEMASARFLYSSIDVHGIVLDSHADSLFQLKNCAWYSTLFAESPWSRLNCPLRLFVMKHGQ